MDHGNGRTLQDDLRGGKFHLRWIAGRHIGTLVPCRVSLVGYRLTCGPLGVRR